MNIVVPIEDLVKAKIDLLLKDYNIVDVKFGVNETQAVKEQLVNLVKECCELALTPTVEQKPKAGYDSNTGYTHDENGEIIMHDCVYRA